MYRSASLGTAVRKYMMDRVERASDAANPASSPSNLKHSGNGPLVVIDARGLHLSRMTSSSSACSDLNPVCMNVPVVHLAAHEPAQKEQKVVRCHLLHTTAATVAKHRQQDQQARKSSFGKAVRALGAKIEAFVHRPFAANPQ